MALRVPVTRRLDAGAAGTPKEITSWRSKAEATL